MIQVLTLYNQSSEKDRLPNLPQSGYWGGLWKFQCQSRTCDTRTASDTEVLNWGILETRVELCLPSLALTPPRICNDLEWEIIGSTQQQLQRTRKFTFWGTCSSVSTRIKVWWGGKDYKPLDLPVVWSEIGPVFQEAVDPWCLTHSKWAASSSLHPHIPDSKSHVPHSNWWEEPYSMEDSPFIRN